MERAEEELLLLQGTCSVVLQTSLFSQKRPILNEYETTCEEPYGAEMLRTPDKYEPFSSLSQSG